MGRNLPLLVAIAAIVASVSTGFAPVPIRPVFTPASRVENVLSSRGRFVPSLLMAEEPKEAEKVESVGEPSTAVSSDGTFYDDEVSRIRLLL